MDYHLKLDIGFVSLKEKCQITKEKLLDLKLPFAEEYNSLVLYGRDRTDESITFWFRNDKNIPDEIYVCGLNNNVTLIEEETLTWQALQLAIWLCFTAHDQGTNRPIMDLVDKIPVMLTITEGWK